MRQRTMVKIIKKNRGSGLVMTKEQEEAIKLAENFTKMDFSNPIGWTGYYDTELKELSEAIETVLSMLKEKDADIEKVLELIFQYGQIDGDHHKAWVIDQIVRILTGDKYKEWVKEYTYDEETGECYGWNKGIAP